jgi:hypothetical protein
VRITRGKRRVVRVDEHQLNAVAFIVALESQQPRFEASHSRATVRREHHGDNTFLSNEESE